MSYKIKINPEEDGKIASALTGNEDAFKNLLEDNKQKLMRSMQTLFKNLTESDFDDCWQNTCLKSWVNLGKFKGKSHFSTWLYCIFKNEVLLFSKNKYNIDKNEIKINDFNHEDVNNSDSYDSVFTSFSDSKFADSASIILEKKELVIQYKKLIEDAMKRLEPHHSKVLELVLIEGKTHIEAAKLLKIPVGTVMSRLFFARKKVQKNILHNAFLDKVELPI